MNAAVDQAGDKRRKPGGEEASSRRQGTGGGGKDIFRVAVLASGNGSNLQAIIDRLHRRPPSPRASGDVAGKAAGDVPAPLSIEVVLVVSDVPGARALERAEEAGIRTLVCSFDGWKTRAQHDLAMAEAIKEAEADLIVLAGYMRLVSPEFVRVFRGRVINLHPALLPAFPGTTSIADALRYGVKVTGVTVHLVDEGLDTGPIVAQRPVRVEEGDTAESLAARIHAVEHELLPDTIRLIAAGRVRSPLPGERVVQVDWDQSNEDFDGGD